MKEAASPSNNHKTKHPMGIVTFKMILIMIKIITSKVSKYFQNRLWAKRKLAPRSASLFCLSRMALQDMDNDNLIISWRDFESNSPDLIRNLWKDGDFSDVTLATDDGKVVRAHRVILCSASSKLKMLLRSHEHDNPIVYLPGIDSGHLVNLVEFIYQGKCQVKEELLGEFLNCGKSLGVENLTEYFQNQGNEAKYV